MRRFFTHGFPDGSPISRKGFAQGVRRLSEAFEKMALSFGHVEWRDGHIPYLMIDPVMLGDTFGTVAPKAFDIASVDKDTGLLTITRCFWQVQAHYFSHADISLTATTGTVCAVLNTTDNTMTAAMDYSWTATAPELIPYALYEIVVTTVDGKQVVRVTCDRRGSAITFHG